MGPATHIDTRSPAHNGGTLRRRTRPPLRQRMVVFDTLGRPVVGLNEAPAFG